MFHAERTKQDVQNALVSWPMQVGELVLGAIVCTSTQVNGQAINQRPDGNRCAEHGNSSPDF
jgi:hypothetical protein